jgi:hypothetical protein
MRISDYFKFFRFSRKRRLSRPLALPTDAAPSHAMWVELATRITTQKLHYRSGEEETAAESMHALFGKARELMAANPSAAAFNALSLELLNNCVRPYTARWHGWMTSSHAKDEKPRFKSEIYRRKFREELKKLRGQLLYFEEAFRTLATGSRPSAASKPNTPRRRDEADLGRSLVAGIGEQIRFHQKGLSCADINKKERDFVLERRSLLFKKERMSEAVTDAVGLAFSGGGIRSATVCLGVAQVLAEKKLLAEVDYLSTVSGGGYLGTFLSSFFNKGFTFQTPNKALSDNLAAADDVEPAALRHIRNNSKYLLHGGAWGKLNMAALLLSGLATNILMVLPLPLIVALGLYLLSCLGFWGHSTFAADADSIPTSQAPATILLKYSSLVLLGAWFILTIVRRATLGSPNESKGARLRGVLSSGTVLLLVFCGVVGVLFLVPSLFHLYAFLEFQHKQGWHVSETTISVVVGLLPFLSGLATSILKTGRLQTFFSWLLVLSGPLLYFWIILFVDAKLGLTAHGQWPWLLVLSVTIVLLVWSIFGVDINSGGPHGYYRDRLCECYLARRGKNELTWWQEAVRRLWSGRHHPHEPAPVEERCAAGESKAVEQTDAVGNRLRLPLTDLAKPGLSPYHLVNTIVNLPASANQELRGRDGDFFLISPLVCGSPICGYFSTNELTDKDKNIDLGTAMAISGAAAAPNMGFHTLPQFRFLMALFNVRLGYWIPNLGIPKSAPGRGVGLGYLLREMAGHMNENLPFLNLSDGGHIENLGVYELLRRKCKFIICVHGGASLGTERGDLQRLQRYVKIDLGIELEYDLSDLQPDAARQVRAYATLVKVKYGKGEIGWMIYLKPAITGGEPPYVLDFRCAAPEFPNEGLLDQAYSEEKFEAYRALGQWLAESLFREEIVGRSQPGSICKWFQNLADNLLPDNDEAWIQRDP